MKNIIKSILPIVMSIIALLISIRSCQVSKQQLSLSQNQNILANTPFIRDTFNADSTKLSFFVDKDGMELQAMRITFPNKIRTGNFLINSKPFEIRCDYLEELGESFLSEHIGRKDSVIMVGNIGIPIIIDYSINNNGYHISHREYRNLVYFMTASNDINLYLKNTFLFGSCNAFENITQDSIEVQKFLDSQLEEMVSNVHQ